MEKVRIVVVRWEGEDEGAIGRVLRILNETEINLEKWNEKENVMVFYESDIAVVVFEGLDSRLTKELERLKNCEEIEGIDEEDFFWANEYGLLIGNVIDGLETIKEWLKMRGVEYEIKFYDYY